MPHLSSPSLADHSMTTDPLDSSSHRKPGGLQNPNSELSHRESSPTHDQYEPPVLASPPESPGPPRMLPFVRRFNLNMRLENSGSVARDHLALERTYLAYVRTSLAVASTGVALVQLFKISDARSQETPSLSNLHGAARPLGVITILLGLMILLIGVHRYFVTQFTLTTGFFPVARLQIIGASFTLTGLIIATFAILLSNTK